MKTVFPMTMIWIKLLTIWKGGVGEGGEGNIKAFDSIVF